MFTPKIIKVKAWNEKDQLMKRIAVIDCKKSELHKNGHILLQYIGMNDKNGKEIFDGDIILLNHQKNIVFWDEDRLQWSLKLISTSDNSATYSQHITPLIAKESLVLCHWYESLSSMEAD